MEVDLEPFYLQNFDSYDTLKGSQKNSTKQLVYGGKNNREKVNQSSGNLETLVDTLIHKFTNLDEYSVPYSKRAKLFPQFCIFC